MPKPQFPINFALASFIYTFFLFPAPTTGPLHTLLLPFVLLFLSILNTRILPPDQNLSPTTNHHYYY